MSQVDPWAAVTLLVTTCPRDTSFVRWSNDAQLLNGGNVRKRDLEDVS
jgi:hypothetical protein